MAGLRLTPWSTGQPVYLGACVRDTGCNAPFQLSDPALQQIARTNVVVTRIHDRDRGAKLMTFKYAESFPQKAAGI